jgi:predicted secreted protein
VLTQFSVGSLLLAGLLPPRQIRSSFFTLHSLLSAVTTALALLLIKINAGAGWWDTRYLGLTVITATAAGGCFRLEKVEIGRLLLLAAGFLGLIFGLLPLADRVLATRGLVTNAPFFFHGTVVLGALLLGAVNVAMILGHWYLLMRRLSFDYLLRFSQLLLGAVALRALGVLAMLSGLRQFDPQLANVFLVPMLSLEGNLVFFVLRVVLGIAVPLVLGLMVIQCVQRQANQAATGLLYIAEVSVLFGELLAAYLLI